MMTLLPGSRHRTLGSYGLIVGLLLLLTGTRAAAQTGRPLATVNGEPFTEGRFRDAVEHLGTQADMIRNNPTLRLQFLDHMIDSDLLLREAESRNMDHSPEFQEKMKEARRELLVKLLIEKSVAQELTEANIKAFYQGNKALFVHKEVRASHILFKDKDKAKAENVLAEATRKDADFAALARKYSTGPSAAKGGDMGFFGRGRMVKEFEDVAFSLDKGKVYPHLVKTQFGYHIIKVVDIRGGEDPSFEELRPDIVAAFKRDRREKIINDLRKKARVNIDEAAVLNAKL